MNSTIRCLVTGRNVCCMLVCILGLTPISNSHAADGSVESLVDEINAQIERAEQEHLADPWFLQGLRKVISKYDYPWRNPIMLESFDSKGSEPPAPWTVTAGEFLIDWRHGLRSVVEAPVASAAAPADGTRAGEEQELAGLLVGALLQQAMGGKERSAEAAKNPAPDQGVGYAQVIAPVPISNAFAIEVELTSRAVAGQANSEFELGPYQGQQADAGYRLILHGSPPAGSPGLELIRRSARGGSSVLELHDKPIALADDQAHTVRWTRDKSGNMSVAVDGSEVLAVTDRGFRDAFDGITIINRAGDFAFRKVQIDGVN